MRKWLIILLFSVPVFSMKAEDIRYSVIFDGLEKTEIIEKSVGYRMIASAVEPAWKIFVSKDFKPFLPLLSKACIEDGEWDKKDDPLNRLIEYVEANYKFLFAYSESNVTFRGGNIVMPENLLLDVAHKYNLPSELESAKFSKDARILSFYKSNEKEILERLLMVVEHMDINKSVRITDLTPGVRVITREEFFKTLYPDRQNFDADDIDDLCQKVAYYIGKDGKGAVNQSLKQKALKWINQVDGKYYVTLKYFLEIQKPEEQSTIYSAVEATLRSVRHSVGNNYLRVQFGEVDERMAFYTDQNYLDQWCNKLLLILYNKFNKCTITDNLGRESKIRIVGPERMFFTEINAKERYDFSVFDLWGQVWQKGALYEGSGLFYPFGIVYNSPDAKTQCNINDHSLRLNPYMCTLSFLLPESEIDKYSSFKLSF